MTFDEAVEIMKTCSSIWAVTYEVTSYMETPARPCCVYTPEKGHHFGATFQEAIERHQGTWKEQYVGSEVLPERVSQRNKEAVRKAAG